MRIGSFGVLLGFTILVVSITVYAIIKIIESSNKQRQMRQQQQQQVVVVQSNPVSQPLQNPTNVIHNVTYNIHDSAIAGDINAGLSEQDGRLNQ